MLDDESLALSTHLLQSPSSTSSPADTPKPQDLLTTLTFSDLRAELSRRQSEPTTRPTCGSNASPHTYNTPLHVFALLLILTLSTLACSLPLLVRRFPNHRFLPASSNSNTSSSSGRLLFLCRHFGTGVLLATAFVHLLPTAYTSLTDPCLPRFWNETYPAMAGFVSMVSVMVVVGIEMVFAMKGAARHSHGGVDMEGLRAGGRQDSGGGGDGALGGERRRYDELEEERAEMPSQELRSPALSDTGSIATRNKPLPPEPPFQDDDESDDLDLDELDPVEEDQRPLNGHATLSAKRSSLANGHGRPRHLRQVSFADPPSDTHPDSPSATEQRQVLQCLLLEAGILFHSVFIGLALSVSVGPAFIVLLIAIAFHQTFEGLALGSRIAAIRSFSTSSLKPWVMSAMYGVTTPIGQAIGLAVHRLYDPASEVGLLTVGLVNAVSSGLLIYAGLVQLLAEDFLSEQSYVDLRGRRRLEACGAVVAGSMLMAFVGAFA
ncbi:hypothetical protein LTR91_006860 [Friedmanniomyces endolithicus]|uniref:Zinc/iron permease n=1 Tax=Friedmanniomyces endolithicus TaxID=329885 RepID=A0AAN6KQ90_9PEZI|nr:hypothetical protein LTR57_017490 [Friedmanniomyces endolithicus]KAK0996648.1 hypothetical protein LTR91_006860 [Friedmanniomyces endolithicus]KAK1026725.1 hypothetical protein LTS16_022101 [Friedmanniomyces endolithicus]